MCFQFRFKCRYSDVEVISDGARKRIPDPWCNACVSSAVVICRILLTVELFLDCYYYCAIAMCGE